MPQAATQAGTTSPGTPIAQPACRGAEGYSASFGGRRTFYLPPDILERLKAARASDPAVRAAYARLIARADAALARGPYTVVDKRTVPPSGDRHDYLSVGPYWWPDPSKPDGLPYLRRDGEINPERSSDKYDLTDLEAMSSDVELLGLAYYYSDDSKYAAHAARMLRTWFLDSATRMNPNMDFGQAVPGREKGRAEGVIDTTRLQRVIDAIGLIGPAKALTGADQAGLERWFGDYVGWMQTSPNGKAEDGAKNNHAMWFDAQAVQFALFARRPEVAKAVVDAFPARRIAPQFTPDGSLPEELIRTRTLHYSIYALLAAYDVAEMGACLGVDLWNYTGAEGKGLKRATDFLAPYSGRLGEWPHKELRPDQGELDELLRRAARAWPGSNYPSASGAELRRFFGAGPAAGEGGPKPN
ncbi:MAG: alginate lyase family protein [Pseudomonadota bacterium]